MQRIGMPRDDRRHCIGFARENAGVRRRAQTQVVAIPVEHDVDSGFSRHAQGQQTLPQLMMVKAHRGTTARLKRLRWSAGG
jgi:hypothetical protein